MDIVIIKPIGWVLVVLAFFALRCVIIGVMLDEPYISVKSVESVCRGMENRYNIRLA